MAEMTRRDFVKAAGVVLASGALVGCGDDGTGDPGQDPTPDPMPGVDPDPTPDPMPMPEPMPDVEPDGPWWLSDNYAPVTDELEAFELEVTGAIPPSLAGVYVRNGANPSSGYSDHWFLGDGMLHGVRLEGGRAQWYRSKYVQTAVLDSEGGGNVPDIRRNQSNTSIVHHAGRLLSLNEIGLPHHIDPADLSTVGLFDFDGGLASPMTAHPKRDPDTGQMHFFGYHFFSPFLQFHTADAAGNLIKSEPIDVPSSTMMHDFQVTGSHAIFMDLPILFDLDSAIAGADFPFAWTPSYGARLGVMPLSGTNADVQWFEIDPCYVFHTMGAFHPGGDPNTIALLAARHETMWEDGPHAFSNGANLTRWTMDLSTGQITTDTLDDRLLEFPQIDPRRQGQPVRYGYGLQYGPQQGDGPGEPGAILKYDLQTGMVSEHRFGAGRLPGEAIFVPDGEGEDEGWLMTFVYDRANNTSSLDIFDATDVSAAPVASIKLPRRVPFGFHGHWVADAG